MIEPRHSYAETRAAFRWRIPARYGAALALALALYGCVAAPPERTVVLIDPATPIEAVWRHGVFDRATAYSATTVDGQAAIRAVGQDSASGLYRRVRFAATDCPWLDWRWRVDKLQDAADIRRRESDDVAASLFFTFGKPENGALPPTLRYVWTNDRVARGAVLDNPYHPGAVRVVVLESGTAELGRWVEESRNLVDDFVRAFGRPPPGAVEMFALFTDNDQTHQPVEAYYGPARARCGP
ncbi:MAG: DUF3047 domain-containing protein [Alphaproteobacteria bacterium]